MCSARVTVDPSDPSEPGEPVRAERRHSGRPAGQADDLFRQADDALPDFARYAELNAQARELVTRALEMLEAG